MQIVQRGERLVRAEGARVDADHPGARRALGQSVPASEIFVIFDLTTIHIPVRFEVLFWSYFTGPVSQILQKLDHDITLSISRKEFADKIETSGAFCDRW